MGTHSYAAGGERDQVSRSAGRLLSRVVLRGTRRRGRDRHGNGAAVVPEGPEVAPGSPLHVAHAQARESDIWMTTTAVLAFLSLAAWPVGVCLALVG